ncbi:30S ribosomal protein S11 [Candidatus Woesebacteria bacterium]|nr:30S ribosomal protein S11 [Candidatus Woesebacteria bacterium]
MAVNNRQTKQKRQVDHAIVHVTSTFNNTIITVTDKSNHPIVVASTGMFGFTGARKSTPHASTVTTDSAIKKAMNDYGVRRIDVYVKGIGPGREASLRLLKVCGCEIEKVVDVTPVPHNGVRPPKIRRV